MLTQASSDACSEPLVHWQDAGALVTLLFHLSVIPCFTRWINDVNCLSVMIIWMNLM
jgi:hypothetical protein